MKQQATLLHAPIATRLTGDPMVLRITRDLAVDNPHVHALLADANAHARSTTPLI